MIIIGHDIPIPSHPHSQGEEKESRVITHCVHRRLINLTFCSH